MKKIIAIACALVAFACAMSAQNVCFWTYDAESLPIRIYVDEQYMCDITVAYDSEPVFGTEGCANVQMTPDKHKISAVNKYGFMYSGWPGTLRPRADADNMICLAAGKWSQVNHSDYPFLFVGWDPLFWPGPVYHHHHHHYSPHNDDAMLISMAVAAFAGAAAMTAAATSNWKFPDNRFPYVSAGYVFEIMPELGVIRNMARLRSRIGNLGGLSFFGDAGMLSCEYMNKFTWDVGFGLDYGNFDFSFRYKPSFAYDDETFLVAGINYDILFTPHFGMNLGCGFGLSGWGQNGLMDNFEFPLSAGLFVKF